MLNQQCVVVKADNVANITSEADLAGKSACVEGGSAGAAYAESVTDADKIFAICNFVPNWYGEKSMDLVKANFQNVFTYYPCCLNKNSDYGE
jgi:ABC-type amino acid transport substrate-binding protein